MPNSSPLAADEALALLVEAAREAGEIGLRYAREGAETYTKADQSPVTEADLAIDRHLRERLCAVPGIGWLSEESADDPSRLSLDQVWIVDPIDGTRGFVARSTEWVVSAALVEAGRPIAGVLFRPTTDELYIATRGGGAYLDGRRLAVPAGPAAEARAVAGPTPYVNRARAAMPQLERQPKLASLALRFALVAQGDYDLAFAWQGSHDWDLAATDLIVHEAGGLVGDRTGTALAYNRPEPVHPQLIACAQARAAEWLPLLHD